MLFIELIQSLKDTNSSNDKKEILIDVLKGDTDNYLHNAIYYILNPYYKFGVSLERIEKRRIALNKNEYSDFIGLDYSNVYDLLDDLKDRVITGYKAVDSSIKFIDNASDEYRYIFECALNKDLDCQVGISIINKIVKGANNTKFIPEFNVGLATKIDDVLKGNDYLDFNKTKYIASRKLDGIRCVSIFNDEGTDVQFFSREGNEFLTLGKVKEILLDIAKEFPDITKYVLDGEVCIMNDGNEDFKKIVGDIKRKDFTVENPYYWMFDIIRKEDFMNEFGESPFIQRLEFMNSLSLYLETQYSGILQYTDILDEKIFNISLEEARNNNWEGLIVRNVNAPYEGKRTKNMIKVKDFDDAEYVVEGIEVGTQPILVDGIMKTVEVLARVNIRHKGTVVGVGSGFTLDEKLNYFNNPNEIIGKLITVRYFEETEDDMGNPSLRFPTFQGIRNYE